MLHLNSSFGAKHFPLWRYIGGFKSSQTMKNEDVYFALDSGESTLFPGMLLNQI